MRLGFEVGLELDGRIVVHRNTEGSRDGGYFFEVGLELDGRTVVHRDTAESRDWG